MAMCLSVCKYYEVCARSAHNVKGIQQAASYATTGSGRTVTDPDGQTHIEYSTYCGEHGNYKMFIRIKEDKDV